MHNNIRSHSVVVYSLSTDIERLCVSQWIVIRKPYMFCFSYRNFLFCVGSGKRVWVGSPWKFMVEESKVRWRNSIGFHFCLLFPTTLFSNSSFLFSSSSEPYFVYPSLFIPFFMFFLTCCPTILIVCWSKIKIIYKECSKNLVKIIPINI